MITKQSKDRYTAAHYKHTLERTPSVVKDGLYCPPTIPKVNTANGMQTFITNYINWIGGNVTRVNVVGMMRGGRRVYSTTRRGTGDIVGSVCGKSCQFEVKVGKDKPSEYQLKEQERQIKSGGYYFFTHTPEEFFEQLDQVLGNK